MGAARAGVIRRAAPARSEWSSPRPGWVGIVYAQLYGVSLLARHGLSAFARHPLLRAVNLDSAFYKVPTTEQLAGYAASVPEDFRFMVKAYAGITALPDSSMAVLSARARLYACAQCVRREVG